jgi:hypothetical protein
MMLVNAGHSFAVGLRREIAARNAALVKARGLLHVESYGEQPVIVYEPSDDGKLHGNFVDASYAAILKNENWRKRLGKVHSQAARSLPKRDRRWMELDSSTSSDALLMNVFCFPGVPAQLASMLGVDVAETPEFGLKAKVPLANGHFDRTEVDMKLGTLLVEAKLTESHFQVKSKDVVDGYRDFAKVFHRRLLPRLGECYRSYQLIRNVLAAHATSSSFCVCLDSRRPDLLEEWFAVMSAVRDMDLKTRCKVLTWQEMSSSLPPELQNFLDLKYGIVPPGMVPTPVPGLDGAADEA